MTLFSRADDAHSHWVRFVLAEKALGVRLIEADVARPPEDLIDLNPYQAVPTLIDRDLVVYEARIVSRVSRRALSAPGAAAHGSGGPRSDPGSAAPDRAGLVRAAAGARGQRPP